MLQTNSAAVAIADFYLHRDYIAKNLCENRDKPQMKCCGKCYLKKKLAKEGKEQLPGSRSQKNEQVVNLFCSTASFSIVQYPRVAEAERYFSYNDLHTFSTSQSVFHPPTV